MPQATFDFAVEDFGSFIDRWSAFKLATGQTPSCQNVVIEPKRIYKRSGSAKLNASVIDTNPITGIGTYYNKAGTVKKLVAASGTSVYQWTSPNFVAIKESLTAGGLPRFATLADLLIYVNGKDAPRKWDGTNEAALSGSPPTASMLAVHYGRLFLNNITYPSRVHWSGAGNPQTWGANDYDDFAPDDNDSVTYIGSHHGQLLVGKGRSLRALQGTDPNDFIPLETYDPVHGIVGPLAVAEIEAIVYFWSNDGLYRFNGISTKEVTGAAEGQESVVSNFISNINQAYRSGITLTAWKNKLWCAVPYGASQTTNNRILVYDPQYDLFYPFVGQNASCFVRHAPTAAFNLYFGDATTGTVWQADTGTNDGTTAVNAFWQSADEDLEQAESLKVWRKLWIYAQSSAATSLTVSTSSDYGNTWSDKTMSITGTANPEAYSAYMATRSKFLRLKVANSTASQSFELQRLRLKGRIVRAR